MKDYNEKYLGRFKKTDEVSKQFIEKIKALTEAQVN